MQKAIQKKLGSIGGQNATNTKHGREYQKANQ